MIGKNISDLRRKRGMTLSELAEKSNISKSYLSVIERNINENPSIQVIMKLAAVLDVDLKTILGDGIVPEQILETEWLEFINDLKKSGVDKRQLKEYKALFEFIKWQKEKINSE
jgi:XRE family transcriptional regulator, master regulator for biofilm formation